MVVALFGLSLVMILGGVAAIVQGFPYVRLESGLAMVIGGATAASAGVILLGLSAVVMRLARLERAFIEARAGEGVAAPGAVEPVPPLPSPLPTPLPSPLPAPFPSPSAGTAGLAGLSVGAGGLRAEPRLDEPDGAPSVPEALRTEPRFEESPRRDVEPALPDFLLSAADETEPQTPRLAAERRAIPEPSPAYGEDDLFTPGKRDGTPDEASRIGEGTGEKTVADERPPVGEPKAEERVVVGTYASGGNTYVMFADGSIEADTPRGRFTFGSLAELKAFVEAGGESGDTRGAA